MLYGTVRYLPIDMVVYPSIGTTTARTQKAEQILLTVYQIYIPPNCTPMHTCGTLAHRL